MNLCPDERVNENARSLGGTFTTVGGKGWPKLDYSISQDVAALSASPSVKIDLAYSRSACAVGSMPYRSSVRAKAKRDDFHNS